MDEKRIEEENKEIESTLKSLGYEEDFKTHYIIVDIHANLNNRKFNKDLDSVINRAKESGVLKMITVAANIESSKESLRLSQLYPDIVFCTAGVNARCCNQWNDESEAAIREIAKNRDCVAIGECGLDFSTNREDSPRDKQLEVFEKQVKLGCELKKPLIIHYSRDAHSELISVLERHIRDLPVVVIHCFNGNKLEAQEYIDLGFYISLTGLVCKDDKGIASQILSEKVIPLDRLLIESDSPFCYPNIKSTKLSENCKKCLTQRSLSYLNRYCTFTRNELCSLPITVEIIAFYLGLSAADLALKTTYNALKVFGLT